MFEIAQFEAERRVVGAAAVAVALSLLTVLYLAIAPEIINQVDFSEFVEAYPESLREAFGVDAIGTIEGFLATELYQFGWVILLGLYYAYSAGSIVAGDIERGRMDLLLSTPVSRAKITVEKFLGLVPSIVVVNAVVAVVVYVGSILINEPLSLVDLLVVHALSVPYLLTTAGIGLLFSVVASRESLAQRAAMGLVFGLFMLEAVVVNTDYEWAGGFSPSRYYDPTDILVHGEYDLAGAAILMEAAILLLIVSVLWFQRRDV